MSKFDRRMPLPDVTKEDGELYEILRIMACYPEVTDAEFKEINLILKEHKAAAPGKFTDLDALLIRAKAKDFNVTAAKLIAAYRELKEH